MHEPNFFIAGAPKCGTSALAGYLQSHPQAFVSTPKEPLYYCEDLPGARRVTDPDDYARLFARAPREARAIGEASAMYLYSSVALARIHTQHPDAQILVMLRNPVELVRAYHSELCFALNEDEPDFARAWRLQDQRRRGERIPRHCIEPAYLLYRDVCRLGTQLERCYAHFPREQVKLLFLEDLVRDSRSVYLDVLAFLGLSDDGREVFPRINPAKTHRSAVLSRITQKPPRVLLRAADAVKRCLGVDRIGALDGLREWNTRPIAHVPLAPGLHAELVEAFAEEVSRVEALSGRNLQHWLHGDLDAAARPSARLASVR